MTTENHTIVNNTKKEFENLKDFTSEVNSLAQMTKYMVNIAYYVGKAEKDLTMKNGQQINVSHVKNMNNELYNRISALKRIHT